MSVMSPHMAKSEHAQNVQKLERKRKKKIKEPVKNTEHKSK